MKVKFLDLQKQYLSIQKEITIAIHDVINGCEFIGGKHVKNFENSFADYVGVRHCVGVGNGTDALEIALESLDLPLLSEVIVPGNSWISTAEAVSRSGLKIVFCKCDESFTMDIHDLKEKISSRTAAIIPVHLYGHPCEMDEILQICKLKGISIIEDCAQAHGAEYRGRKVGSIGDLGCFSFYPGKNLGAYGDAGCIVTNNDQLAEKIRLIKDHGRLSKNEHVMEGRNSRLDGLQAAILSVKLKRLEDWIFARRSVAQTYKTLLSEFSHNCVLPSEKDHVRHVYHLYVIKVTQRDLLKSFLESANVQCGIHYPKAITAMSAYSNHFQFEKLGIESENLKLLSLPIGEHLTEAQIKYVTSNMDIFFSKYC